MCVTDLFFNIGENSGISKNIVFSRLHCPPEKTLRKKRVYNSCFLVDISIQPGFENSATGKEQSGLACTASVSGKLQEPLGSL